MAEEQGITNFNPNDWKKGFMTWENAQGNRVEWHYVVNPKTGKILSQKAYVPGPNKTSDWLDIK
ncbi:PepSY domain-containing protein [Brevibacillus sp. HB2.2]|uniref:PepSY domain-containing protein n=1 Tax=Brevibacillus sp. HB2.2 TaxID=2738846 RepID=UPI00156BA6FF|nr:PepSY domain-containing protein [Brevibacillus sp. HB2.2]NRS48443.1 PepSY domain-containing protein [Brevibacillus sp. HB2.2]